MPSVPPTPFLQIQPGKALGPLVLSASLYTTLTTLLRHKSTFPRLEISFSSASPVSNPIYIDLEANGLRLRFDGESQHLELIEVTEFGKIGLKYADTNLSRHGPPSFRSVYKTFGPTSPGELLSATSSSQQTYILSYPGIAFKFSVPSDAPTFPSDKDLLNFLHKKDPCLATSLVIFSAGSWAEARKTLNQSRPCAAKKKDKKRDATPDDSEEICFAEIFPNEQIDLVFERGNTIPLIYGSFTAQDAITLLGPPNEVHTKSDTRLNIHNSNHNNHSFQDEISTGPLSEAPDYFFNYFPYGLSLLFSPSQSHTLQKILLHANLPQSHAFHRFHRLRWKLNPTSSAPSRKKDQAKDILTSESHFDEIKSYLERFSGPTGKPMIVSRGGQGSPSSSIEFFSDDIRTTSPFGCTELFGFATEGLVFEVIEGWKRDRVGVPSMTTIGTATLTKMKPAKKKSMAILHKISFFNLKKAKSNDIAEVTYSIKIGDQDGTSDECMSQAIVHSPGEGEFTISTGTQISTDASGEADISELLPSTKVEQGTDLLNRGYSKAMDSCIQGTEHKSPSICDTGQYFPLSSHRQNSCDSIGSSSSTDSSDYESCFTSSQSSTPATSSLTISSSSISPAYISPPNIVDSAVIQSASSKERGLTRESAITNEQDSAAAPDGERTAYVSESPAIDNKGLQGLNSVPYSPVPATPVAYLEVPTKKTTSSLKPNKGKENKFSFKRAVCVVKRKMGSRRDISQDNATPVLPSLSPSLGVFDPRLSQLSIQTLNLPGSSQPQTYPEQLENVGSSEISSPVREISGMKREKLCLDKRRKQLVEDDRILAEKLQLLEDEELHRRRLEHEKLTEKFIRVEEEAEKARLEELAKIAIDDAAYAAELVRQEVALNAERRERERIAREEREQKEAVERQKKAEAEQVSKSIKTMGVTITVRRVNTLGVLVDVSHKELTLGIVQLLKDVKDSFTESLKTKRVRRIEYIINPKLQEQFDKTRGKLHECGHSTDEVLLFHGTMSNNINPIITGGFKVGGVEGHPYRHGSSMGIGIYSSRQANIPVNSYNAGGHRVIAFRALPGNISGVSIHSPAGKVGEDVFDSHMSGGIYVIRRPCQALPCFLKYMKLRPQLAISILKLKIPSP